MLLHRALLLPTLLLFAACGPLPSGDTSLDLENWPSQPVQIACFSGAGGGTDLTVRQIARLMEPELGVKINVVNRTAARGGAALNFVWSQKRDGYNWGGFSESILPASVMGIHYTSSKDWTYFMVAGAPGVISVAPESPWSTLQEFLRHVRDNHGKVKVAASSMGGIWHTKMLILQEAADVEFLFMPFQGSQKSQTALLTGEVAAVLTSISEQSELIKGGKLRPLAMVESEAFEFPEIGMIPSAAESYPEIHRFPIQQWLGFALPNDTPEPILRKIGAAFDAAMQKPEVQNLRRERMLNLYGLRGEEASKRIGRSERIWLWMLHDLGVTSRSPEAFGIERL